MNIVCAYHPEDGRTEIFGHNLDDAQVQEMLFSLRARGLGVEVIRQVRTHPKELETCELCQKTVELHFRKLRRAELPARLANAGPFRLGQGNISTSLEPDSKSILNPVVRRRVKQGVPVVAGISLLVLIWAITAGPWARSVEAFLKAMLPVNSPVTLLASPTPSSLPILIPSATQTPLSSRPSPTPTSNPTATLQPTSTPFPLTPTPEASCFVSNLISMDQVGMEVCVSGVVEKTFERDNIFYVVFDDQPNSLYLVSYDGAGKKIKAKDCIVVTGTIRPLGKRPIIILSWTTPIEACEP